MRNSRDTLTGPSDILAALPGIFGFYPQESTVIVGLYPPEKTQDPVRLGPVMRVDISDTGQLLPAFNDTPGGECCAFFTFIISRIPNSDMVEMATKQLFSLSDSQGDPLIDACWHVSEIAQGTPYTIVFGPTPAQMAARGMSNTWLNGTVASVASSPAMRSHLNNGALPELRREDTFAFFDPWETDAAQHPDIDQKAAERRAQQLTALLTQQHPQCCDILADACSILHTASDLPLTTAMEFDPDTSVFDTPGDAIELAAILGSSVTRDCLIVDSFASPTRSATAFLWIAKSYSGVIRANALTLWAVVAAYLDLHSWAVIALARAQEEVPGHNLSNLLLTMLHNGLHTEVVEAAAGGCAALWAGVDPTCTS